MTRKIADEDGKDVENVQVDIPSSAVHNTPAVTATTCSSKWRRDARVLGSPPFVHWGRWAPSCATPTLFREYLFFSRRGAVGKLSLRDSSPRSDRPLLCLVGSWVAALQPCPPFLGHKKSPTHSPQREVVSGPATQRVPTPRLLGVSQEWRCLSSRPCCLVAVRSRLFGLPAREI